MGALITTNQQEKIALQGQTGLSTNFSLHDVRTAFYGGKVSQNDAIRAYLQSQLGITTPQSLNDLWRQFFIFKCAANQMSLGDMARYFFTNIGFNTTPASLLTNLIGYWKFDENFGSNANDSSAKANHGVWAVASGWTPGIINSGGSLTGANDVTVGSPTNLGLSGNNQFAISLWTKPSAANASNALFDLGAQTANERLSVIYTATYALRSSHFANDFTFTTTLDQNAWNHIVLSYDGTTESLYKNGTFRESWTPTALSLVSSVPLLFGKSIDGNFCGAGAIDEYAFWSRGVTSGEVTTLYNSGIGKQYPF